MKKRVLSMVLALSMMLTLFPASAFAAGDTGGGISPDQVTPQSVDTENAAGLTSATTITADKVASSGYEITKGGEYNLEAGDYDDNPITIATTDDVTLNLTGDINNACGCFLDFSGADTTYAPCKIVINGNGHTVAGTDSLGYPGLISAQGQFVTLQLNDVKLTNEERPIFSMERCAAFVTINNSTLHSDSPYYSAIYIENTTDRTSQLTISNNSTVSTKSTNNPVVDLAGSCEFKLTDSTISGGSVGVDITPKGTSNATTLELENCTIENAAVAGVKWESSGSSADGLTLTNAAFKNNTVDILLPNVDSSNTSSYYNVMFTVMSLATDVTFSFPKAENSFTAGFCYSDDALTHLKTDKGTLELEGLATIIYNPNGSSTTKQDPDSTAYNIQLNGNSRTVFSFAWEDCVGKTLADLKLTAAKEDGSDTNDYGEATIHYYSLKDNSTDPDYTKEISDTTALEAGHSYYAAVKTAGNDTYNACLYTDTAALITIRKPAPEAKNFKVELTVNNTTYDLDNVTDTVVVPCNTNYEVDANEIGSYTSVIYPCYRKASKPDASWTLFEDSYPIEAGTYQIGLKVIAYSSASYSSGIVTKDNWVFTIGTPKQDPDNFAYSLQRNGEAFSYGHFSCEDWAGKTLADLKLTAVEAAGDTNDYGEATIHYYSLKDNSTDPDYTKEISDTTALEAGHSYYAAVKTAGNDTYNACLYTMTAALILIRKPAPKADNYNVKLVTSDGNVYDFTEAKAVVVPYGTKYDFNGSKTTSTAGDVYGVCYRSTSGSDTDWKYVLTDGRPTKPGKYQIGLGVKSTDEYSEGIVTSDKWVFTIGQAELDDATIKSSFTFADGKVTASDALTGKVGDITVVYYDSNNKVVSEGKAPTEPGEYKVGFKMTATDSYKAYDSNGPVDGWTYTVKAAPEQQNYTVRLNGVDVTKLTVDNGLVYNKRLVIDAEANKGVTTGAVLGIYVAPVQANGQVDLTTLYKNDPDLLKLLLVPGTYQVVLNVAESDATRADELFTSSNWHFTINKATVDKADYSKFTYDADTQTITVPSAYSAHISSDDVTVLYYQNDKVVSKGTAPTEPGTYQVGFSIRETEYYKALEGTGPVSDWTYIVKDAPKAENYEVTVNGFDITELDAPIKYQQQITVEAEAKSGTGTGDVCSDTIQYALVQADGKPDFDHAVSLDKLVPGTYQVRFEVTGSNLYNSGYVTDPAWRFTVERTELPEDAITYDPITNEISSTYSLLISAEDFTLQYYTEDGELVTDLAADKNEPRVAGTYKVGYTFKGNDFYNAASATGDETGWTYTVKQHFISLKDFDVTVGNKTYDASGEPLSFTYSGEPVEVSVTAHDGILPVGDVTVTYTDANNNVLSGAPTEAGTYTCTISVATNFNNRGFTTSTQSFTIDQNADLDDAITVNVPTNVREGDESGFDVTVTINDATLTADDLEITYVAEDGTESTEAPTKAGVYTYKITVKDTAKNYTAGSVLSGNYTIYSTEPTITGGELTTEDGSLPAPGTKVTIKAPENTDTNVFQQWVISVDGKEVQPTAKDLKEKLGVDVADDDAALAALQDPEFTFTMPEGKLSIYALTSNPQQEAFEKAVGTTLIVGGAAAATGAVYYFGTTAYIRSQLPEGMAVPQNREQLAVALWTLAGKPATESTAVFTDVAADSEALPAIRWAVETGVLNAKTTEDGTTFLAGNYVTRAETAYRIYKLQQQRAQ